MSEVLRSQRVAVVRDGSVDPCVEQGLEGGSDLGCSGRYGGSLCCEWSGLAVENHPWVARVGVKGCAVKHRLSAVTRRVDPQGGATRRRTGAGHYAVGLLISSKRVFFFYPPTLFASTLLPSLPLYIVTHDGAPADESSTYGVRRTVGVGLRNGRVRANTQGTHERGSGGGLQPGWSGLGFLWGGHEH